MPAEFRRYGETWTRLHPGWTMQLWSEATLPRLRNQVLFDTARTLAPGRAGQFRADLARYEILAAHGGVYLDTDFEALRFIEPLLVDVEAFAAWEEQGVWINQAILGCRPGHPFLERLITGLADSVQAHPGARPNVTTGPQYLTRMWRADPGGLTVFDQALFYPYHWRELDRRGESFPDAYAVHHWANQRRRRAASL